MLNSSKVKPPRSPVFLGLALTVIFQSYSHAQMLCRSSVQTAATVIADSASRPPLPPDREPILTKERAQEILRETEKIGDYSLVQIGLSPRVKIKVIVDSKADWLLRAAEKFAGKPAASLDQKTIKAFLEDLSHRDLKELLQPKLRMYRGVTREMMRDGEIYYLEEMIASGKRSDLAIALIGQVLLEGFAKKDSRVVRITPEGAAQPVFGLMIMNGNPDVIIPGKCANAACGSQAVVVASELKSTAAPASPGAKDRKQISVLDSNGQAHVIQVSSRSAIERAIKEEREIYAAAGPNDLVPIEIYHMTAYLAGGTTMFRAGDSMFHFGGAGWEHKPGTEGVKGFLISNPYSKRMYQSYKGMGLPPFNVGIKLMVPKHQVEQVIAEIQTDLQKPEELKERFNYIRNNCVQVLLRIFTKAGLDLGKPDGFYGFSSSLTFRNLFLQPKYAVQSVQIYPNPGVDLTEAQYRSEFPQFIYRAYSVGRDRQLAYLPGSAKDRYQETVLLEAVARSGAAGLGEVVNTMKTSGVIEQDVELNGRLEKAAERGWINLETLSLTQTGQETLMERSQDYDLTATIPR